MKFAELKECPFCGNDEFVEKEYAYGSLLHRSRFDGEQADNSDLYDGLRYKYSGRVYCSQCRKVLGNRIENTVSKSAEKKLQEGENGVST